MAKKKHTQISISEEENTQVQHVLEQYHQIANNLHASEDQKQVETALAEINTLSESVQMALLKGLSKENQVDAADVLIAINELSPLKSIRKEARRSLIRLESAKIYPHWEPPIDRTPAIGAIQLTTNTPRFWKGLVSDTRALGEVQLLLCWEQGEDYKEIRILGFLLEFMYDGVKDFFSSIDTKRGFDKFVAEVRASMPDVETRDCSLARGRRLLLEALAVNKQYGTAPSKDYRFNFSLVKQLILEAPDLEEDTDLEEKSEENVNLHGLHPHDVIVDFVESWVNEDYDIAYNLLSLDSPLREGLSRDEWIERRESWADEVHPDNLKPDFMYEHEPQKSQLWTPDPLSVSDPTTHKEIETGWSITLDKVPSDNTLPELPKATVIYEETGRHWFWPRYILVQENDDWRIQNVTDEGMNAQNLSVEELQHKIEDLYARAKEFADRYTPEEVEQLKDEDMRYYIAATSRRIIQAIYHTDILIKKLSLDFSLYEQAALRMAAANQYERSLAYLRPMTQRFPEQRGLWLRRMAAVQKLLSKELFDEGYDEQAERSLELAEEALRESLAVENTIEAHISIAELLIEDNERLDEAEDQLLQAKELITNPEEEAHIELHLGEIATEREQFDKALSHYQRIVVELQPDSSEAWFDVGEAHEALEHFEEAETSYKRAIELEPDNEGYYYTLSKLYTVNDQPLKAIEALEQGIIANPDSTILHLYLVGVLIESGDYHQAEILLNKVERIDPESELVHMYHLLLNLSKPKYTYDAKKLNKPLKQKKKRR